MGAFVARDAVVDVGLTLQNVEFRGQQVERRAPRPQFDASGQRLALHAAEGEAEVEAIDLARFHTEIAARVERLGHS